ncbi:uncharacterized protein [Spinacia oleracea]|uniref:Uncharacterized protein n=1 Tax=Spinacia oleracea TaxID=3562 RepID=A0A9R0I7U1_SPIOL|nr:uncharacterized protein LOC110783118 [Spinacia oleracea]XP_056694427.1 uncharacterized protein LOC110783118 [Spinacia oleracea]XP_056694428.1 uncharacterized protein LOC110783118 [Spinacia oleracea]
MDSARKRKSADSATVLKKTGDIVDDFWPLKLKDPFENLSRFQENGKCYNRFFYSFLRVSKDGEYGDDIKKMVSELPDMEIGDPFDVLSLLSFKGQSNYLVRNNNDNDQVELNKDTFHGKYVMVCWFHVPIHCLDGDALFIQSAANICYEMFDLFDDFEIVLGLKMNPKYNNQRVFSHFLSAFPPSCLVVPFDDPKRSDYICCYLEVRIRCECFLVDGNSIALFSGEPDFEMGERVSASRLCSNYSAKDLEIISLPKITRLRSIINNTVVRRINEEGVQEEMSFLRLNEKKVVGLYLWTEGIRCITDESFIDTLDMVNKQCRGTKQEFEIVVVYIPFLHCIPPKIYQAKIDNFMEKKKISWWRMPFNTICNKLGNTADVFLVS